MKQASNTDAARELILAEKVEQDLSRRGVSSSPAPVIRNRQTNNYLQRDGHRGLERNNLRGEFTGRTFFG